MSRREFVASFREARGVPAVGLIGGDAIREAFEGDLRDLSSLLEGAIKKALELTGDKDWWPYVHGLFDDRVVIETKAGKLLSYPYTVSGTDVTLGAPVEVIKDFRPVDGAERVAEAGAFVEGEAAGNGAWRIRVIRGGLSGNGNLYPDAVLREAVPLFEGVRCFVKSDADHLAGRGKDVRNLIGALSDAAFVEGAEAGEIQATLRLIEPEGTIAVQLREAWRQGLSGLFGFSVDAVAAARAGVEAGRPIREARKFLKVKSVDLIVEPGAGGGVINLIEARKDTAMDRDDIIALLEAKGLLKGRKVEELSDGQLIAILREALDDRSGAAAAEGDGGSEGVTAEDMREAVRAVESRQTMRERIGRSTLPAKAKSRLVARFEGVERFTEAEVEQAIKDEAEYLASFTESGHVRGLGEGGRIVVGDGRFEKVGQMLDAFFDQGHRDHRHAQSFREAYAFITGDTRVTGQLRNCDQSILRESLGSDSFDAVLGDAITRRMIADYRAGTRYDVWRRLATTVPVNDFRSQERTRFGGYGDLPAVGQSGPYLALASPTDEKASYAVSKRGGTEDVTLEMIKNDDVGTIRQIPVKLSRSAKRTLGKFVLDFLATNPVIYDGATLFHASHGNLGTAALDKASFAAGRLAMLSQTELDSGDKIGIPPRFLWVPDDLEETAVDLFRRNTEQDKTFVQSQRIEVMPVWYWTDANDWCLSTDPADIPTIEIGFLDGNEEPELFVQDSPTSGSMFTHDKLTWKIRHIYGGNALDYRGLYKSVVA